MQSLILETPRLKLTAKTREETIAYLEKLSAKDRAEVSAAWLAQLEKSSECDPWVHGFALVHRDSNAPIGSCGFKGPPDAAGVVEIAYGVEPVQENKGYATEAAAALVAFAFDSESVKLVCAHTLPQSLASGRVLTKCGFRHVGEVMDPEDGLVWRWELKRSVTESRL